MNETDAVVVRIEGGNAWVRAAGPGHACGACAQKDGCATASAAGSAIDGALGQTAGSRLLCLPNAIHARPGDRVVIRAADGTVLRAVWLAYGLPLLLALLGALVLLGLTGSDAAAVAGMLAGLGAGIFVMYRKSRVAAHAEPILSIAFKSAS